MKKIISVIVLILVIIGLFYYFGPYQERAEEDPINQNKDFDNISLANPAAVYCQTQGGTLEIFDFESGQDAYCFFEDGSVCWEWDFFEERCGKGQMQIEILQEGQDRPAEKGDKVAVHYTGTLLDGTQFDSSFDAGEPFSFVLGEEKVIRGWEQGVLGMRVGQKRRLILAPELAYGERGHGTIIPPSAILIFEIDLLENLTKK